MLIKDWLAENVQRTLDERLLPLILALFLLLLQIIYVVRCTLRVLLGLGSIPWMSIAQHFKNFVLETFERSERYAVRAYGVARQIQLPSKHFVESIIGTYGGYTIFAFHLFRVLGTIALIKLEGEVFCDEVINLHSLDICANDPIVFTQLFGLLQSLIALGPRRWRVHSTNCYNLVMLSILGVYVIRDVWPLATYTTLPKDERQPFLWSKIGLITLLTIGVPLLIPHRYIPIDPQSSSIPHPEQTASWISALTYTYLDPLISLANKVPHLRHDQLPPLADYDHTKHLTDSAFQFIIPCPDTKRRHLFFGLVRYFWKDYAIMALTFILLSALNFAAPIGINETLKYIETRGNGTLQHIKPWFWISLMFVGPVFQSICSHWNMFVQTQLRVRVQTVLTQLVFEHSLRMRIKAQVPDVLEPGDVSLGINNPSSHQTSQERGTSFQTTKATLQGEPNMSQTQRKKAANAENLIGKINNLLTSDMSNIEEGVDFLILGLAIPLQITFSMIFLYRILGWSALVGLGTILAMSPLQGYFGKRAQDTQIVKMKQTDARVQSITEAVGVLRMIKMFGWENKMTRMLAEKREEELGWLWRMKIFRLSNILISLFIPMLTMLSTYTTYSAIMKEELTASKIFSSIAVFTILRDQLFSVAYYVGVLVEAIVSLDRINDFMKYTELLDNFSKTKENFASEDEIENIPDTKIGFRNAIFAWSNEGNDGTLTPSSRRFRLRVENELIFKRNAINLIVGPTGSGKTSILMALLGEMHFIRSTADSWVNLPREDGIAYAAQESWVENATIKENILFGSPYDEKRYKNVIQQCALDSDLVLFDAGDDTEIGERGLTLSGGQKARITLARAIYSPAKILLLDDVFAALDVHTSSWIVEHCLKGDLVKARTIILVTHNVALVGPLADFVISLGPGGVISTSDGIDKDVFVNLRLSSVHGSPSVSPVTEGETGITTITGTDEGSGGKLVIPEEIVEGHITWRSTKLLLSALGGEHPAFFVLFWLFGLVFADIVLTFSTWFLGFWGSQYEKAETPNVNLPFYISFFTFLLFANMVVASCVNFYFNYRSIDASRIIHAKLVNSIFGSTLRWLDETPTARIIARCTQDIRTIDGPLPQCVILVLERTVGMLLKLVAIVLFTPIFALPGIVVALVGAFIGKRYLRAQLSIKREMSNAKSPVLSHFNAALHGLVSIRAYGAQSAFTEESYRRIDHFSRAARTSWTANRWVGFRIDLLGAAFTSALAFYLVYGRTVSAANTGFSLNMSVSFCLYIFWLIRLFNQLEVESNSLERIQGYIDIEHESISTETGKPPAAWPTNGDIRSVNLSARYSKDGPVVLHDISFHIRSGERIGVVGRTGSGKSSLLLSLLRCIPTDGNIYYDGIPTSSINLEALRSNITIIPQVPELLSGTLRQNLDPFEEHDDATLNATLKSAGFYSVQGHAGEAQLTLDGVIAGGGSNFSVGQRQVIALARAMVRRSKLLILDEATSAVDYETEGIIQDTLRNQLGADVTVIIVAHRLQTIMDADRIMVLDKGHLVEFDTPEILLKREEGLFKALVDASRDRSSLYTLSKRNK